MKKTTNREKNLLKNTIIIFISKFCTQFLSLFLLLPLVTSQLTTSEYGIYDLIRTYGSVLTPFLTIQLESALFRFLIDVRNDLDGKEKIISSGIISMSLNLILVSFIYAILTIAFKIDNAGYIYFFAISSVLLSSLLEICRGFGETRNYAIGSLITGFLNLLFCFIFVFLLKYKVRGMILSIVLSNLLGIIYMSFKLRIIRYIKISKWDFNQSKKMIKYSLPLVPNNITSWILNVSDKVMITYYISTAATGIYSISTKFPILLSHIYSVFNLSWTESASVSSTDDDKSIFFSEQINNIFKICSSCCLITLASMPILFRIMINESFYDAYKYVPILICSSIFEIMSGLLGAIYISLKQSKNIAFTTFICCLINVFINLLFIKKYGIVIACISTLASYSTLAIIRYINIQKYVRIRLDFGKYLMIIIIFTILTYLYYFNSIITSIISVIIAIIFAIFLNLEFLLIIKKNILRRIKN